MPTVGRVWGRINTAHTLRHRQILSSLHRCTTVRALLVLGWHSSLMVAVLGLSSTLSPCNALLSGGGISPAARSLWFPNARLSAHFIKSLFGPFTVRRSIARRGAAQDPALLIVYADGHDYVPGLNLQSPQQDSTWRGGSANRFLTTPSGKILIAGRLTYARTLFNSFYRSRRTVASSRLPLVDAQQKRRSVYPDLRGLAQC